MASPYLDKNVFKIRRPFAFRRIAPPGLDKDAFMENQGPIHFSVGSLALGGIMKTSSGRPEALHFSVGVVSTRRLQEEYLKKT